MAKVWSYFLFLLWLSYLMTSGLILFINGFFLTRVSRPERSNCTNCRKEVTCDPQELLRNLTSVDICLEPRGRVVLLVIDALKYDFLEWTENPPPENYHRNKIPVVKELLKVAPNNARLFKSIADPPTTTMQRIKALTTGTLPTFIDISSNFATGQIEEDNIIDQNSGSAVFMGDDTWTSLYPGKFLRQFPSPSFNVLDLDTVDRDVRNRIFFELQRKDWSLLIAHTLGIDHCGHKHGQNHPEMIRKLNETNELLKEIIEVLDDNTVLFVVGDHGMTESGDHGGDSPSEVEAAMFVYSKLQLQDEFNLKNFRSVNQIDIVPTISAILGTPAPFSNIGAVIPDVIPKFQNATMISHHPWYTINTVWRNVLQTKRYIEAYSSETFLFTEEKLQRLEKMYDGLRDRLQRISDEDSVEDFIKSSRDYLKFLRDSCIEVWVQFDATLMSQGLVLMFCSLFSMYLILTGIPELRMLRIFDSSFLRFSIIGNLSSALVIYVLYTFKILENFKNTNFMTTGIVSLVCLAILIIQNWDVISTTWYDNSKNSRINYLLRIIFGLTMCGLFSNSYVINEDKVLSFLLITTIWILVYSINEEPEISEKKHKSFKTNPYKQKILLITMGFFVCLTVRLSSYFWRCREEQLKDSCTTFILGKVGSMTSNNFERILLMITLVGLAFYITIVRIWLRNCGNLSGYSLATIVARYCPGLMVVCIGSYWVLQRLPKDARVKFVFSWQMNALPVVVYFCVILAILVIFVKPLQVFLLPRHRETLSVYRDENIVPKLFEKVKKLFYRKNDNEDEVPIVYGLGTVYSGVFVSLSVFAILIYAMLLGNVLAPSTLLLVSTGTIVLGIVAIERFRNANDVNELMQVPTAAIFCWFLVGEYFFYGTGHQPTFPTIYWDAAFVGTGGHFYGNFIPAVLIGINTFGSHMIMALTLPLLTISPFTIFVMIPKLAKIKFRAEDDMKRGELILFDKDSTFHHSVFNAAGKYVLFHGFRTFGCMFAATIHCRHLMVWKIFAPKLIFEGLSFFVTLGSLLVSYFLIIRIDNQVEKLITRVTKTR